MKRLKLRKQIQFIAGVSLALTGCSNPTAFTPAVFSKAQTAPGLYSIPPKLDLLLVLDDTGSMGELNQQMEMELPRFLQNLDALDFDYHFTTMPLTKLSFNDFSQVVGSKYDANRPNWVEPYPGAAQDLKDPALRARLMLNSGVFRTPENFLFPNYSSPDDVSKGSAEPGLKNISRILAQGFGPTRFLRDDSLFVVLIVGNGNDDSGVNYCVSTSGMWGTRTMRCEEMTSSLCASLPADLGKACGSYALSLNYYKEKILSLPRPPRVYAAVSAKDTSSCWGSAYSYAGTRYKALAEATGGGSYDICSTSVSAVLSSLSYELQAQRLAYRTRFIVLKDRPNPETIQVTRFINGDSSMAVEIPRSKVNGWSYVDQEREEYLVETDKVQLNKTRGYMVELHGDAILTGTDTAEVKYKAAGVTDTNSHEE